MSTCIRCGADFSCGMADGSGNEPCWCTQLPVLTAEGLQTLNAGNPSATCFCPACLASHPDCIQTDAV